MVNLGGLVRDVAIGKTRPTRVSKIFNLSSVVWIIFVGKKRAASSLVVKVKYP
jgi:hypothetical protein